MTIERIETPLARHAKIENWGLEPIRRLDGDVVDYDYYLARGRQAHGEAIFAAVKSLFGLVSRLGALAGSSNKAHGKDRTASETFREAQLT